MSTCVACSHELVPDGRFCTSCGHPVEAVTGGGTSDGTEHTAVLPVAAPLPSTPPPSTPPPAPAGSMSSGPPRFPLFADQVHADPVSADQTGRSGPPVPMPDDATTPLPVVPAAAPAPAPAPLPSPPEPDPGHRRARGRPGWPVWLTGAVVLVLVVALGTWLVAGRGDGGRGGNAGTPRELTAGAAVSVPATAPPGEDTHGNPVSYAAGNLLDGVPDTCWRMPGDGAGATITIRLPERATLRHVGLVNGYAKSAHENGQVLDWYHGDRRVLEVEWSFDDGTSVRQDLTDTTAMQSVDVDVTTSTVRLKLLKVSPPGTGPAARNYTAISDLSLVGIPR